MWGRRGVWRWMWGWLRWIGIAVPLSNADSTAWSPIQSVITTSDNKTG